jgi:hypothetical protein
MTEYFSAREVLTETLARARRITCRVPMGAILEWQQAEVSMTPAQYRALTIDAPAADSEGVLGPDI